MPIFEYACEKCGLKSAILVMRTDAQADVRCKHCGCGDLRRLVSRFAVHQTEASRLSGLNTGKTPDESFYRDDRNIGLTAKKRMQELGVDLGDRLDEKIEKARTSKIDGLLEE